MKLQHLKKPGFTLVELMIVMAIIGLLVAIAVPNYCKSRQTSHMTACISNLRQIDGAVQTWAAENKKGLRVAVTYGDIEDYLKGQVICPAGGTTFANSYALSCASSQPTCLRVASGPYAHQLPP